MKKAGQPVERDEIDPVVEVDMARALNPEQLFRFGGLSIGVFAELLECARSPLTNSIGRGEIVSMSLNG